LYLLASSTVTCFGYVIYLGYKTCVCRTGCVNLESRMSVVYIE
jgi:hypothetical protein